MKKFKCIMIIILMFFIIYFLQLNFFSWFNINGIMPNLFVLLVLFIGLFMGKSLGMVFGLAFGLFLDIMIGRKVGLSGIFLGIVGLIGEYFDKNFSKDNRFMIIIISIGCTVIYEVLNYIYNYLRFKINLEIQPFIVNLLIENLYNTLIVLIFYGGFKKLGYYLEENFKGKTFLTRYF